MTAPAQESGSGRTPGYPFIPMETWWRLRKQFQSKGMPRPAWNEEYLVNQGLRTNTQSASNLVRPFKRMGIFGEDGKPTPRAYDWVEDGKYAEVCAQILQDIYPETLRHSFTTTDDETRALLEKWFQRHLEVSPTAARNYAAFYMLLLEADPSKQEEVATKKTQQKPKASQAASGGSQSRSSGAKAKEPSASGQDRRNGNTHGTQDEPRRAARNIEPMLNINVQLHIPPEATIEQIDQICGSLAKYLYKWHDEVDE